MDQITKMISTLEALPDSVTKKELELAWCGEVLKRNDGNRTKCAKVLGVSYHTIVTYVKELKKMGYEAEYPKRGIKKERL
jgi:transposase